jgi:hypothetical protein
MQRREIQSEIQAVSKKALWTGYVLSALPMLFLLMDSVMKLLKLVPFDLKARIGWICWLRNSRLDQRIQRIQELWT